MSSKGAQFDTTANRRRFLQWIAGSSAIAWTGSNQLSEAIEAHNRLPDPMMWAPRNLNYMISSPKSPCSGQAQTTAHPL